MDFDIVDKAVNISGKRHSGKSEITNYIIHQYHNEFSKIIVISGTEKVNKFYQKNPYINPKFIYDKFDSSFIDALLKSMEKANEGKTKKDKDFKRVLLIMDDVFSSFNAHTEHSFEKIFTIGRHLGITILALTQYLMMLPPRCRVNCDWLLVGQMNQASLDILASEFRYGDIGINDFKKMFLRNTSDYGFLLISANSAKNNSDLNSIYGCIRTPSEYVNKN